MTVTFAFMRVFYSHHTPAFRYRPYQPEFPSRYLLSTRIANTQTFACVFVVCKVSANKAFSRHRKPMQVIFHTSMHSASRAQPSQVALAGVLATEPSGPPFVSQQGNHANSLCSSHNSSAYMYIHEGLQHIYAYMCVLVCPHGLLCAVCLVDCAALRA